MGLFNLSVIVVCFLLGILLYEQPALIKLIAFLPVAITVVVFYLFRSIRQRDESIRRLRNRVDELEKLLKGKS